MVRWPGYIKPGQISNEIISHHDWLPTLLAMAGDTEITDKLLKGYQVADMTYKVHLDGYNLVPYLRSYKDRRPTLQGCSLRSAIPRSTHTSTLS